MKATVKVQEHGTNTSISIPKDFKNALGLKKGQTLLLTLDGKTGRIIVEK